MALRANISPTILEGKPNGRGGLSAACSEERVTASRISLSRPPHVGRCAFSFNLRRGLCWTHHAVWTRSHPLQASFDLIRYIEGAMHCIDLRYHNAYLMYAVYRDSLSWFSGSQNEGSTYLQFHAASPRITDAWGFRDLCRIEPCRVDRARKASWYTGCN